MDVVVVVMQIVVVMFQWIELYELVGQNERGESKELLGSFHSD